MSQTQRQELENWLDVGTKLVDLLSGREYYEITEIWVAEDLTTHVTLRRYWNNTDSMVAKGTISVDIEDIAERLEENEIAFM